MAGVRPPGDLVQLIPPGPLARARRELAAAARLIGPVLTDLAQYRARAASLEEIERRTGLQSEDVRIALMALEVAGLAEATHWKVTDDGITAAKEEA